VGEKIKPVDDKALLRERILELVAEYASVAFGKPQFIPGITQIPASEKLIGAAEVSNMVEASLDGWLTSGRFNAVFEKNLAKFVGVKYALTVNSGSSANLVAFSTLTSPRLGARAVKRGDEVISVAAGFPTTINPIMQAGAVPVFIDIDLETLNIDVSRIEQAISSKTKAIMLAHTLGNPFNLEAVTSICKRYNLWLIEDCCDALGTTYDGQHVGTFGDLATLSFYPAHHITMGEGGAILTCNPELKSIAESFRDWGRDCYCPPGKDNTCGKRFSWKFGDLPAGYDHKYTYTHMGYNLKITDTQAACAVAQLARLDGFIEKRRQNFLFLNNRLSGVKKFLRPASPTLKSVPSWFGFPLTVQENAGIRRIELIEYLDQFNIGTRLLFAGNITKQPYMKEQFFRISGELQNTDIVMNNTFWLGIHPRLEVEHLNFIAEKIDQFFGLNF